MAAMLLLLMVVSLMVNLSTSDFLSSCPSLCTCKWSSGKQTADCSGKGLTTVPQDIHHDVQVRIDGNILRMHLAHISCEQTLEPYLRDYS